MQYMNATQAALEIGISYRTMRRRIDTGQIEAERGEDGQYSIAVSEVERLKRAQSERPVPATRRQEETGHDHAELEQRIADLELRVRTLEDMASRDKTAIEPSVTHLSHNPPIQEKQAQNRILEPYRPGMLSASEFAESIGLSYNDMKNCIRRGVNGELFEVTERQHHNKTRNGKPVKEYFLTPEQGARAIEVLRRHGKIE